MTTLHVPAQRQGPTTTSAPGQVVVDLGWRRIVRVTTARAALALVGSLVFWSMLPMLAGMTPRLILSGSMEPRIHVGDVIVTRSVPAATLTKGQVITVKNPDHPGRTRTHRLFRRAADGTIVTKGDANPTADSSHVSPADVLGLGVLRVPFVGRPAYWVAEHNWVALGVTGILLSWVGISAFAATRREEDEDVAAPPTSGPSTGGDAGPGRRTRRVRQAAAVAAATAIVVGAAVAPAQAAFHRTTVNPTSSLSAAASFYAYNTAVLGDTPSFFWRLDETSGTVVDDETTNNRDATLASASSTWGQAGALTSESNSALKTSQAAITANTAVAGPTAFTVEAWVKTTSTAGGRILGFGNASGTTGSTTVDRQLYLGTTGKAYFGVGTAKTVVASTTAINNGAWHYLVGTYTSGTNGMKLYVDGTLQGSATATPVTLTGYWRAGAESMTGWTANPGQYFDGTLDELAVYPTALTATQVQAHETASGN
jgi:signal peptidase I